MKKIILLLAVILSFYACDNSDEQLEKDIERIEAYLKANNIEAESTGDGVYYVIEKQGDGEKPEETSWVKVRYEGMLMEDSTTFDKGTAENHLINYIKGWRQGMQVFKEGGKGTLFIPSILGYGDEDNGIIPPNSNLIFKVELLEVRHQELGKK